MRLKVHGGTASGTESLCNTCRFATVVRGPRLRDEIVECGKLSTARRVRFPVNSCTSFVDFQHPSLREMEELAWVLKVDERRRQAGFVQGKDLPWDERYVLD